MPSVFEIHDKMKVVYIELTCNWVKSKVAKSKFLFVDKFKTWENCKESSLLIPFCSV